MYVEKYEIIKKKKTKKMFRAVMLFIRIDKRKFRLVISLFDKETKFNTEKTSEVENRPNTMYMRLS